jgi:hypothetical protein
VRFIIHITTLEESIRFFAKSGTREEAHAEGLAYIHAWPLDARNQPCGLRIEESSWMYAELPHQPKGGRHDA